MLVWALYHTENPDQVVNLAQNCSTCDAIDGDRTLHGLSNRVGKHYLYSRDSHSPESSLWRNRLARSAVNRKVGGSSPPRDVSFDSLLAAHSANAQRRAFYFHSIQLRFPLCCTNHRELTGLPFCRKHVTRSGVRTHADICPLELKSNALTTRPSWCLVKAAP